jgi:hypothetical protein
LTSPREVARDPKLTSPLAPLPMGGEVNDPRDLAPGATGDQPPNPPTTTTRKATP